MHLYLAAALNQVEAVKMLLQVPGMDLIHCMESFGHVVHVLLKAGGIDVNKSPRGINVNLTYKKGAPALQYACIYNYTRIVALLLSSPRIDHIIRVKNGDTVFSWGLEMTTMNW